MQSVPFESFTYPFFDFSYNTNVSTLVDSFLNPRKGALRRKGKKGLYIHIPFCDTICTFCPFVKTVGQKERIENYVKALLLEMDMVAATEKSQSLVFDAVYIGGGTPSLLSKQQIDRIFESLRRNFQLSDSVEISFEVEAKSTDRNLIIHLKNLGVTRISFGVQTFDPDIRPLVNLTATDDQIRETISLSAEFFERTNMDLMVGFPLHDEARALRDIERASNSGIASVSIYPVDYIMTLPKFVDRIKRGEIPAPPESKERHRLFHLARRALREHFEEHNIYCYGKKDARPCRYMFEILYGGYHEEYIGLGCSSYTCLSGIIYQNIPDEEDYIRTVNAGSLPLSAASPYHAYEKGLVFFPKRLTYDLSELTELSLYDLYKERIDRLISLGLVRVNGEQLELTEDGQDNYSALMVEFFSDSQRRLYARICKKLASQVGWNELGMEVNIPRVQTKRPWGGIISMTPSYEALQQ